MSIGSQTCKQSRRLSRKTVGSRLSNRAKESWLSTSAPGFNPRRDNAQYEDPYIQLWPEAQSDLKLHRFVVAEVGCEGEEDALWLVERVPVEQERRALPPDAARRVADVVPNPRHVVHLCSENERVAALWFLCELCST